MILKIYGQKKEILSFGLIKLTSIKKCLERKDMISVLLMHHSIVETNIFNNKFSYLVD